MNFETAMARASVGFLVARGAWAGGPLQYQTVTGDGEGGFLVRGGPPVQEKPAATREDLEAMTKEELRNAANSSGVDTDSDDLKADIVNKILRAQRTATRAKMLGGYEPTEEDQSATDWSER